ncbi:hypothetical protein [Rhizobium sp. 007]|nr:hypothetical protein [Rhizobium sp. 007]QPB24803.1 hypothetical protein ISN39_35825 [Rhizobium sp. 007]
MRSSFPVCRLSRDISLSKGEIIMQQLAIKVPFFIEIEASFETDWNRRE